jgi:signal transduction histidine kinase/ActR/RegA family two-component response regulator
MNKLKALLQHYIFAEGLPFDARVLNMVCFCGIFSGVLSLIARLFEHSSFLTILAVLMIIVGCGGMFILVNRFHFYSAVSLWFVLVAMADILYPLIFFTNGGINSGLSAFFVLSITTIFLLSRGIPFALMLLSHIAVIIACYIIGYSYPEFITPLTPLQSLVDNTAAVIVSGLFIGIVIKFQTRLYDLETSKAQAAGTAKADFLANMSHEMRTPMNAITGMTAIALSTDEVERKDYCLTKIDAASGHLLGVINDILDMSKIGANKLELSPVEFRFDETVDNIVNIIRFRVDEKKQYLEEKIDKNIPPLLFGDQQRLAQVMANLLTNAAKFTPEGGEIKFSSILEQEEDGVCTIRVEVSDTGIGVTQEQQVRLFTSFEQADSSIARKYGGTGLGLSISKSIVELMGGNIWVESEPGQGSVFSFRVQLLRATQASAAETAPADSVDPAVQETEPRDFSPWRILLVDDVDINREIVMVLLEDTQLQIDCAENGVEALALYCADPSRYHIIFMDIQMPEMDGYEATRSIRAFEAEQQIKRPVPIIAMTANVFREDVEKCLAAGMDGHVGKPIDFEDVMAELQKFLPGS